MDIFENKYKYNTGLASIVIVNYNGLEFLKTCIESLKKQTYNNLNIIVVDNNSQDESIHFLEKEYPDVYIVKNNKNEGFAGGNNRGIEYAMKNFKPEYIITLNNDTTQEPNWIEKLLAGFEHDVKIGITTSKIRFMYKFLTIEIIPSETLEISNIRVNNIEYKIIDYTNNLHKVFIPKKQLVKKTIYKFSIPVNENSEYLEIIASHSNFKVIVVKDDESRIQIEHVNGLVKLNKLRDKSYWLIQNAGSILSHKYLYFRDKYFCKIDRLTTNEFADAGCGCAMAIKADLIDKYGMFDESYFMYNEDSELSWRLYKQGYRILMVNDAIIYHYFWGTSGIISDIKIYYGTRNRLWFARKYFGIKRFLYYYIMSIARCGIWGFASIKNKNARIYFINYLKVLKDAWKTR